MTRTAKNGEGIKQTNMRGETPIQAFSISAVEALAPLLRDAIQGREITEGEARKRFEYQLERRGFDMSDECEGDPNCDQETFAWERNCHRCGANRWSNE